MKSFHWRFRGNDKTDDDDDDDDGDDDNDDDDDDDDYDDTFITSRKKRAFSFCVNFLYSFLFFNPCFINRINDDLFCALLPFSLYLVYI